MKKIFISIASFNDPMLGFTVRSAIEMAKDKTRLVFGVVEQDEKIRVPEGKNVFEIRKLRFLPQESQGACWARAHAQSLYGGEEYYLQVDSHTVFTRDWDERLIGLLSKEEETYRKPLITAYPLGFEINESKALNLVKGFKNLTYTIKPNLNDSKESDFPLMVFKSECIESKAGIQGTHVAGGLMFARGNFVEEVPYDPNFYFLGEEQGIAMRAFTRGWTIIHPNEMDILYHQYKTTGVPNESQHWNAKWEAERKVKWSELHAKSKKRMCDLILGRIEEPKYSLGSTRDFGEFERATGFNYRQKVREFEAGHIEKAAKAALPSLG